MPKNELKLHGMNDYVYYKMTPAGIEIMKKVALKNQALCNDYGLDFEKHPYKDDWYQDQLWGLFEGFGPFVMIGKPIYIYDLTFDDPTVGAANV